jgi:hypothetical protein
VESLTVIGSFQFTGMKRKKQRFSARSAKTSEDELRAKAASLKKL